MQHHLFLFVFVISSPMLCFLDQPPKVGTVLASPLTSSCLEVMWYYTVDQVCTSLGMSRKKIYRLSYRVHESDNSTWSVSIEYKPSH